MGRKILNNGLILILTVLAVSACFQQKADSAQTKETVYERVMRTKTLRCGYFVEAPFTIRNEMTGEMSGLAVDLAKKIADELNLTIEWTEQMNWGTYPQDLINRRYDMVCSGLFILPRGNIADYTHPFVFAPVYGYVRKDDASFDKDFNTIDWSNVKIPGIDGEGATTAIKKILSESELIALPDLASITEMLVMTQTAKTDITFVMPTVFESFEKTNPGIMRKAELGQPLYQYAVSYGVAQGEQDFKTLINNTITQLSVSGELDMIHNQYDPKGHFKRPVIYRDN